MVNRRKQTLLAVGSVLILAIALSVTAVFAQVESQSAGQVEALTAAQPVLQGDDGAQDEPEAGDAEDTDEVAPLAPFARRGGRGGSRGHGFGGQLEGLTPMEELMAESLGVTVEQLQEAHALVREAAITESGGEFPGRRGFVPSDELNALLAEALSEVSGKEITVETLEAAHEAAREAMLAQLPEELRPSEEQLALMEAHQALKGVIDREVVMLEAAEAVGLDPAALLEALENRGALFTLLDEAGVTVEQFAAAQQEAHNNAVQSAVPEFITQEQADLILDSDFGGPHGTFQGHHGRGNCPGADGFGDQGGPGGRGGRGGPGGGPGGLGSGNGYAPTSGVSL